MAVNITTGARHRAASCGQHRYALTHLLRVAVQNNNLFSLNKICYYAINWSNSSRSANVLKFADLQNVAELAKLQAAQLAPVKASPNTLSPPSDNAAPLCQLCDIIHDPVEGMETCPKV